MDLFRKNQKIIFWIVTIIIVPSFVLVWGVSGTFDQASGGGNYEIGTVDGKKIHYPEFDLFRKRIQAAVGGIPLQLPVAPGRDTPAEDVWRYLITYSLLQDAEKAGCRASDLQVGTYIDNAHPTISGRAKDPEARTRAVEALCRQLQIKFSDFREGVRDWQTIGNYIFTDSDLAAVSDEAVYRVYSFVTAELGVKRIRVQETDEIREQARKEIMEKPAADLDREVRVHIEANFNKPKYREPARWRFAYVFTPFVSKVSVRQPSDDEIRQRYDAVASYMYQNQAFEDVRDAIRDELVKEEVENQTKRNQRMDVDPQLRAQSADLALAELVKLTPLAKYGVTAGETGAEALPLEEAIAQLPAGTAFVLRGMLEQIDAAPPAFREQFLAEWRAGFDLTSQPYRADGGLYRLRLLDYAPSRPADIEGEDGMVKKEFVDEAVIEMIGDRAARLTEERAAETERRIRDHMLAVERGEADPDSELARELAELAVETIPYAEITGDATVLARLPIGEVAGPFPYTGPEGAKGIELVLVADRRLPSREAYEALSAVEKSQLRQTAMSEFRGNFGFSYTQNGPVAVIQPGPAVLGGIFDRLAKSLITINPELLRTDGGEG